MSSTNTFAANVKFYFDKRIVTIFFLGMSQGFPWVIISSSLTVWLKDSGIDRATIGYAGAILFSYAINFLWSPLIDRFNFGWLGKRLGNRRAWILSMQGIIAGGCFIVGLFSPETDLRALVIVCIVIGVVAATQDIAIDAYRIESFAEGQKEYLAAASSAITAGWWTGYAGLGFFPLWLSDFPNWDWPEIYPFMSVVMIGLMLVTLLSKKATETKRHQQQDLEKRYTTLLAGQSKRYNTILLTATCSVPVIAFWTLFGNIGLSEAIADWSGFIFLIIVIELIIISIILRQLWIVVDHTPPSSTGSISRLHTILAWLLVTLIQPLKQFFTRNGLALGLAILGFIILFKFGESFLGRMSIQFYKEVGFSNTVIAVFSKLGTWWVTIVCALIGGLINIKFGIVRGLFISGIAMASTNLLFSALALIGPNLPLYGFAIVVDGLAAAWSTVSFVALMSLLCDRTFTATQYALMVSLGTLGRTLLSSTGGEVVNQLDGNWSLFFAITSLMVLPSLILLFYLKKKLTFLEQR